MYFSDWLNSAIKYTKFVPEHEGDYKHLYIALCLAVMCMTRSEWHLIAIILAYMCGVLPILMSIYTSLFMYFCSTICLICLANPAQVSKSFLYWMYQETEQRILTFYISIERHSRTYII